MVKNKRNQTIIIYFILVFIGIAFYPVGNTAALENDPVIDITTIPTNRLFHVSNLAPGDIITKTIKIKNDGNIDFHYKITVKHETGSEKLYNQLLLTVMDENEVVYDGKLSKFFDFPLRYLSALHQEDLKLKVTFPKVSGNDYQGMETSMILRFTAESDSPSDKPLPPDEPADDSMTPNAPPSTDEPTDNSPSDGSTLDNPPGEPPSENQGSGISNLPQTGERNPMMYYLLGFFLMIFGLILLFKKESGKKVKL